MKKDMTIREMQKIAEDNKFYLCPITAWDSLMNKAWCLTQEIERLKVSRNLWMKKEKEARIKKNGNS